MIFTQPLPWLQQIFSCNPVNPQPGCPNIIQRLPNSRNFTSLGDFLTGFLDVVFIIAGFLMLFWLVWGIFQYIFAGGNKEGLAKAKSRITWAIVGFLIVVISFAISQYVQQIFFPKGINQNVTPITVPPVIP